MKQHNYAVDLSTLGKQAQWNFSLGLKQTAEKYNWSQLSFNPEKTYFRFKLITDSKDISDNNDKIFKPGFYYWTANSMVDTDYSLVNIDRAIELLKGIDQSEFEETLVDDQPLTKVNSSTFKIACRQIRVADYETLKTLMKKYDIDSLDIVTNSDNFILNEQNLKTIDKFLKTKRG